MARSQDKTPHEKLRVKKIFIRVAIAVTVLFVLSFAVRQGMIWNKTRDVLPTFTAVPAGPRGFVRVLVAFEP